MQFFFKEKNISQNHLMGVITCIPKGDKLRNKLKNWRPITLLNSIYKFYSAIWANRIKQFLPKLINHNQTGFVQNRFIGENTRLTLDILTESLNENTSGLLILVDFEKAFDSISWDYIEKILNLFNFSDQTIQVVKSLQANSLSKILQNGHSSDIIKLSRGCRQGDPISPYIFVLAVELLGVSIREDTELQGYIVKGKEHRISQFAYDTTLFIKYNDRNLRLCMDILEEFYLISGLKINVDKTKVVKFGRNRDSSDILCQDLKLIWTSSFTSLGISYDVTDLNNITFLNIEPKLQEIETLIRMWRIRNLTLIGKITLIKSLFISKFIHILLSLPTPSETLFNKIETLFENFLWNGKPPKFRKQILERITGEGGLHYPNIRSIDATMKVSWFKRLYKTDIGWAALPYSFNFGNIYIYGDLYLEKLLVEVRNMFWNDCIRSLLLLTKKQVYHGTESILSMPLWYNSRIISWKIPSWVNKGVMMIGDILGTDGKILSMDQIQHRWDVPCNFLLHLSLKMKIQQIVSQKNIVYSYMNPMMSYTLHDIGIGNSGNQNTYFNINSDNDNIVIDIRDKWANSFNEDIFPSTIHRSFKNAKQFATSAYQHLNQFKLIHRRTINNQLLRRMNLSDTENCLYCNEGPETIEHIYLQCRNSIKIWFDTVSWVRSIYDPQFTISDHEKIFGGITNNQVLNVLILSVKDVIYQKRKVGKEFTLSEVKKCLLKNLSILKSKELVLTGTDEFVNRWNPFIQDLNEDIYTRNSWYTI